MRPQDSAIAVLRFKDVMERAERASSLVSLGSLGARFDSWTGLCTVSVLEKNANVVLPPISAGCFA